MRNWFAIGIILLGSCVKDKPAVLPAETATPAGKGVFVVNEGNFGSANAGISLFDPATGNVTEDIYRTANQSALGDVAQSLGYFEGSYYVVVNNSGKVVRCDGAFRKNAELSLRSPRYLVPVTPIKAYVSDYLSGEIAVIDLPSYKKVKAIPCPGWAEQMTAVFDMVYITNILSRYAYVADVKTDVIIDSIDVGEGAASIVRDRHDFVWVLASGGFSANARGRLTKIDSRNRRAVLTLDFQPGVTPKFLCRNRAADTLYFVANDIYRMAASDGKLPGQPFLKAEGRTIYALGIHPASGQLYLSDALDYSQRSNVYRYSPDGTSLGFFKAGINANGFFFE